jgi:DnaK suppressor protein
LTLVALTDEDQLPNLTRPFGRILGAFARRERHGREAFCHQDTEMNKAQLKKFRALLEEKRDEIVKKAKQTLDEDMTLDANDLPDEMDLASSEYLQSFTFRLRGREKSFLDKITKALAKIDDGTFGTCEECGEDVSLKRLEARPETTLCIRCKEDQERMEKDYG